MKSAGQLIWGIILLLLGFGCKKPFTPEVISTAPNYLVVEGAINAGSDSTTIKLTRTTQLSDTAKTRAETGAQLYVEDDKSIRHNLVEVGKGIYRSTPLNIQSSQKCRLHIVTSDQKEYLSDDLPINITPPIDSINYIITGTGVQFYTYTHDSSDKYKYFRWDFDETYEYISLYQSIYKYDAVNNKVIPRAGENIFHCWVSDKSNQILLGNSENLSQSVVNALPLAYIDESTGKLAHGYSMLLHQYALTKEAYEYWQKLKKNTEQIGSIFDAQPSELKGNIHNVKDASEPVLGYLSASTVPTKRFLIGHNAIPLFTTNYFPPPTEADCPIKIVALSPANTFGDRLSKALSSGDSILTDDQGFNGMLIGYKYAAKECVDCRAKMKGGTNVKPPYWPDVL